MEHFHPHLKKLSDTLGSEYKFIKSYSHSSCLIQIDCKLITLQIYTSREYILSVSNALFIMNNKNQPNPSVPSVMCVIESGDCWLLATSYLSGERVKAYQVASIIDLSFLLSSSIESQDIIKATNLRTSFHSFYSLIESSIHNSPSFMSLFKKLPLLPPNQRQCLVHGDFAPQNLLFSKSNNTLKLIDWEYSGLGFEGFDKGWFLAVSTFCGFIQSPSIYLNTTNAYYFLCFGYFRLAARILNRHSSQIFLNSLSKTAFDENYFINTSLCFLHSSLVKLLDPQLKRHISSNFQETLYGNNAKLLIQS